MTVSTEKVTAGAFLGGNVRHSRYVINAVPYRGIDLLRIWMALDGKGSGGAFLGGDAFL